MSAAAMFQRGAIALALAALALAGTAGCDTQAYCFDDCGTEAATGTGGSGQGGQGGEACFPNCTGSTSSGSGGAGGGGCIPTGPETCDHVDNDCNGAVDDIPGLDYGALVTCGTCDNNCLQVLLNNDPATLQCIPSSDPGNVPGTCIGQCAEDFYDLDGNGSCEYYCLGSGDPENVCNGLDDDCDGAVDEDVAVCTSVTDCGACGNNCVVLHGTPACVNNGQMPCTPANTQCVIASCDCPDAQGNCWWDLDGIAVTGCEYQCQLTNGGVEICGDGIDNDCDGLIDGADDLSGDPNIGLPCYGDPDGLCATPAYEGQTACINGQIACGGNILVENQMPELCNTIDDDCDGIVDDAPTDAGMSCGQSNNFPCSFGTTVCQNGALICVGAVDPGVESCNGVDDDCDGAIDFNLATNSPPADAVGPCDVPPPPPPGSTSPCMAGTKACVAGTVVCGGSIGPQSPTDGCNVDLNCDGVLTNQPDLMTDVANCGACGNNCYTGSVHSLWSCVGGMCQFQGCEQGYYDPDGDLLCDYPCVFVQQQEVCNNLDDNCDGQIDEGVIPPSPEQQCGVTPGNPYPECTTGVTVTCMNGSWQCTFPPGVCDPDCDTAQETCDALDNDCDGFLNENVPSFGQPCASDDGLPPPGHGACRTTGTYVCSGPDTAVCNAVPSDCASLPGGCEEECDGIDNDCDGLIDESFADKGTNAAYFVRPVVTQIGVSSWMYAYEASRPNATDITPGSGNGYYCTSGSCSGVPPAPSGVTLDRTPACSVPGRLPWFNVTPIEAEQVCQAMGGTVCPTSTWMSACQANMGCTWGYSTACTSPASAGKYCNLGPSFDFAPATPGDQDGLLPTASPDLQNCWANIAGQTGLYDMTGNLREITKSGTNTYPLMGGAFNSTAEIGATCSFDFYTVDQNFKLFDVGFRCCFSSNPTL